MKKPWVAPTIYIAAIIIGYAVLTGSTIGNALGFVGIIGLIVEAVKWFKKSRKKA